MTAWRNAAWLLRWSLRMAAADLRFIDWQQVRELDFSGYAGDGFMPTDSG